MNKYQPGDSVKFGIYHTSIGFEFVSGFVCSVNFLKKVLDVSPVAIHCFDFINEYTLYSKASFKAETCLISRHTNLSPNQYFEKRHSKKYSIGHFGEARGYFNFDELFSDNENIKESYYKHFYIIDKNILAITDIPNDIITEFDDNEMIRYYLHKYDNVLVDPNFY